MRDVPAYGPEEKLLGAFLLAFVVLTALRALVGPRAVRVPRLTAADLAAARGARITAQRAATAARAAGWRDGYDRGLARGTDAGIATGYSLGHELGMLAGQRRQARANARAMLGLPPADDVALRDGSDTPFLDALPALRQRMGGDGRAA
jgi:hypothetical protein